MDLHARLAELSADGEAMRAILGVVAERKLFYLDSRTSAESRGYSQALELGIPSAERQVFLDANPSTEALTQEWMRMLALARERGAVVAIGHPHPQTLALLSREVPRARRLGYEPAEGPPGERFLADLEGHTRRVRELFLRLCARERG